MKTAKNKNLMAKTGQFLLGLFFMLVFFSQTGSASAADISANATVVPDQSSFHDCLVGNVDLLITNNGTKGYSKILQVSYILKRGISYIDPSESHNNYSSRKPDVVVYNPQTQETLVLWYLTNFNIFPGQTLKFEFDVKFTYSFKQFLNNPFSYVRYGGPLVDPQFPDPTVDVKFPQTSAENIKSCLYSDTVTPPTVMTGSQSIKNKYNAVLDGRVVDSGRKADGEEVKLTSKGFYFWLTVPECTPLNSTCHWPESVYDVNILTNDQINGTTRFLDSGTYQYQAYATNEFGGTGIGEIRDFEIKDQFVWEKKDAVVETQGSSVDTTKKTAILKGEIKEVGTDSLGNHSTVESKGIWYWRDGEACFGGSCPKDTAPDSSSGNSITGTTKMLANGKYGYQAFMKVKFADSTIGTFWGSVQYFNMYDVHGPEVITVSSSVVGNSVNLYGTLVNWGINGPEMKPQVINQYKGFYYYKVNNMGGTTKIQVKDTDIFNSPINCKVDNLTPGTYKYYAFAFNAGASIMEGIGEELEFMIGSGGGGTVVELDPAVETLDALNPNPDNLEGKINSPGGVVGSFTSISSKGIWYWSDVPGSPVIPIPSSSAGNEIKVSTPTSLANGLYHFQAFATNSNGKTGVGIVKDFTIGAPAVTSPVNARGIRVIVSWMEKADSGVEVPKRLEFNTFIKKYIANINPPTGPGTGTTTDPVVGLTVTIINDPADRSLGFVDTPGAGTYNVVSGDIMDIHARPLNIEHLVKWEGDSCDYYDEDGKVCMLRNITKSKTIIAKFYKAPAINMFKLTASSDLSCATITPSGVTTVVQGGNQTFTVESNCKRLGITSAVPVILMDGDDKKIQPFVLNNPGFDLLETFSINNVQADHVIRVTFPPITNSCSGATVYTGAEYSGFSAFLSPGLYKIGDDQKCETGVIVNASGVSTGICNDTISSVKLGSNCILTAYADSIAAIKDFAANFKPICGQRTALWDRVSFCTDTPKLIDFGLNDMVSGMIIGNKP